MSLEQHFRLNFMVMCFGMKFTFDIELAAIRHREPS